MSMLERYGMTETNMIASNPYEGERRPGAVGFPLPGSAFASPIPTAARSCRRARSASSRSRAATCSRVTGACRRRPRANSAPTASSSPATSASIDADGYLHIVGRAKDLIISGGFNVYPKEIESEIDAIDGVVESAVIGVPHPDFGEGVTAVVVARAERGSRRGGDPVGARRPTGEIQAAQARAVRRRAAAQRHGQGAEGGAAGDAQGDLRRVGRRRNEKRARRVRADRSGAGHGDGRKRALSGGGGRTSLPAMRRARGW